MLASVKQCLATNRLRWDHLNRVRFLPAANSLAAVLASSSPSSAKRLNFYKCEQVFFSEPTDASCLRVRNEGN